MRPRSLLPSYTLHGPSGQARVVLRSPDGSRKDLYLGRHNSPESKRRYRELLRSLDGAPTEEALARPEPGQATIAYLCASFLRYAFKEYRDGQGRPTGEARNFVDALRLLVELKAESPVASFIIADLRKIREVMIEGGTLCRSTINSRINKIRRVFRWGVEEGFVPAEVWWNLKALAPLQPGRRIVRDSPGSKFPVSDESIERTLPFLPPQVAAMVRLQRATGMRPSEVLRLSMDQIDRSGPDWLYVPKHHKNAWRGQERVIVLRAPLQELLTPFLRMDGKPLFSPTDAERLRGKNRSDTSDSYSLWSYRRAIVRAAAKAGVDSWSPGQLRHTKITEVARKSHRDAQIIAGHKDQRSTSHYIHTTRDDAIDAARRNA